MNERTAPSKTSGRSVGRIALGAALVLATAALGPQVADARPAGAPAPDVTAAALPGSVVTFTGCDGETQTQTGGALLKVDRGTNTSGTISVDVTYGGSLVAGTDYPALPDPVEIPAGQTMTLLPVEATMPGTVTLTVEPGEGYNVGSPATATAETVDDNVEATCHPVVEQTISVGQQPPIVDPATLTEFGGAIGDATLEIVGDLPAGITGDASGFTGTATTPGIYEYTFQYCLGDFCVLEVPYRTIVLAVPTEDPGLPGPAPSAPPATPVTSSPSYTG